MAPAEIWEALGVSRQGAMDLLRPLLDTGVVEKIGGNKTGWGIGGAAIICRLSDKQKGIQVYSTSVGHRRLLT